MQDFLRHVFDQLSRRSDLSTGDARSLFELIMSGRLEPATIGALLGAIAAKGESVDELVGASQAMRANSVPIRCAAACIDTCGAGGDGVSIFNASTTAAIIAAAAGATVAKHGNRSTTRASGSTEVLTELGIDVEASSEAVERCLREIRIGYLNARLLHPAMKYAAPVRQAIPGRTIFNLLGPLTNPAGARRQLLGVPRADLAPLVGGALAKLGAEHAWVVHGLLGRVASAEPEAARGICDVTITGPTLVFEVKGGVVRRFELEPAQFGLPEAPIAALRVGSPSESAAVVQRILAGESGPPRDHALLNAAGALIVAGLAADFRDGLAAASAAIDSGAASRTLSAWRELAPARG